VLLPVLDVPLGDVYDPDVGAGHPQLQQTDQGLENGHRDRRVQDRLEQAHAEHFWSRCEVHEVEHAVEEFITGTHHKQNGPGGVIDADDGIGRSVDELVACLALHQGSLLMYPVTGDVYGHAELEEQHPAGIETGQRHQQAHGGTPIGQLVQHCAEFRSLVQPSCSITINSIQETTQQITQSGFNVVSRHVVKRNDGQNDAPIANEIWNEEKYVFGHRKKEK